jgi:hypothetical protein
MVLLYSTAAMEKSKTVHGMQACRWMSLGFFETRPEDGCSELQRIAANCGRIAAELPESFFSNSPKYGIIK